jgi:hypothetical protein
MGLANKLRNQNKHTAQVLSSAQTPVSVGGYNHQNVPGLRPPPPMLRGDFDNIAIASKEAQADVAQAQHSQAYAGSLQKPNAPRTGDQAKDAINCTIVDKMWRIVTLKSLYAFYTQQKLQELVNRACKHDYLILQNQWQIATMDMTLDLAVLG